MFPGGRAERIIDAYNDILRELVNKLNKTTNYTERDNERLYFICHKLAELQNQICELHSMITMQPPTGKNLAPVKQKEPVEPAGQEWPIYREIW